MFYGRFSGIREREPGGVLNILLRACRCARVWFVRKRSGTVKIPAGWSGKYLWKDGILYRMTRKKSGNTPRGREKWIIRKGNSCWKKRIFLLKKFRRSAKNIETGRKISQFPHEKNLKNIRIVRKDMPENPMTETKKKQIFLLKKFRESKKIMETDRKFSQLHIKRQEKLSRRSEKISENGWSGWKKAADFS